MVQIARLAQLVERVIDVDDAGGSNPSPRTKNLPRTIFVRGSKATACFAWGFEKIFDIFLAEKIKNLGLRKNFVTTKF